MATPDKQIIVLEVTEQNNELIVSGVFWLPISTGALPQTNGSIWTAVSGVSAGASSAENTAIEAGTVKETPFTLNFPLGTPIATIQTTLLQAYTEAAASTSTQGPAQYYGTYYNGTSWGQS
jgi:hypothetical protein